MIIFIVVIVFIVFFVLLARKIQYFMNIAIGFDQLFNTILRGDPDETLSSRAWRLYCDNKYWYSKLPKSFIDGLFLLLGQKDHCQKSYIAECERKHLDEDFKS